jgi:Family of unknown function (DUF5996)
MAPADPIAPWPPLPIADWADTRDTLHLWTQVVGKVKLARTPLVNHWWNVTFFVTDRGLTTGAMPGGPGGAFQVDFDLVDHRLRIGRADGGGTEVALEPRSVADFYAEVSARLDELDLATPIWTMPVEIEGAIPFTDDHEHASYDPHAVEALHRALVDMDRVFHRFRGGFVGKCSPVHFFWGGFDYAVTRFSGRTAPPYPRGAPHCGPHVMLEAYSHEVSSAGYWPNGSDEGTFYSYAYPEPPGYRDWGDLPEGAWYHAELGEFVLPYATVRAADDPDERLADFLQRTYAAAADLGDWDRAALEHV